ncbi:hypothetical protein FB45DRAFT_60400 [Roridomyces roridus]|uniref:Uncharacterized protein n=1 Tax=Roridomyces roridus TaxID=1738132 RepID=A0AAD7BQ89_9AGAR|nr:hypothetical protein FB45DRAFT_60400 [Roridomyces roridus]
MRRGYAFLLKKWRIPPFNHRECRSRLISSGTIRHVQRGFCFKLPPSIPDDQPYANGPSAFSTLSPMSHAYTEPVPAYRDVKRTIRPLPPIPIPIPASPPPPTFDASWDDPEQEPEPEEELEDYPYLQTSVENDNESDSLPTHSTSSTSSSLAFSGQPKRREHRQVRWAPDPEPVEPPEKKRFIRLPSRMKSKKGDRRVPEQPSSPPDEHAQQSLWIEEEEEEQSRDMRMPSQGGERESQWERARERARAREADVFRMRVMDFFGFK